MSSKKLESLLNQIKRAMAESYTNDNEVVELVVKGEIRNMDNDAILKIILAELNNENK